MNRREITTTLTAFMLAACAHARETQRATQGAPEENAAQTPSDVTFVVFADTTDDASQNVSPQLNAALAELSATLSDKLRRQTRPAILANAQTGLLDVAAGRALIDRVNAQYGLALDYASGPYLVVLPRDPNAAAQPGDQVLAAAFRRQATDAIIQSIEAMSAATRATDTRTLSISAILAQIRETWTTHSPVQTHSGNASSASPAHRP